jgi:septation ring formation regulator EzrA
LIEENKKAELSIGETETQFNEAKNKYDEITGIKDKYFQEVQETRIKLITIEREKETTNYRFQNAIDTIKELSNRMKIIEKELQSFQDIIKQGELEQKELKIDLERLNDKLNLVKNNENKVNKRKSRYIK